MIPDRVRQRVFEELGSPPEAVKLLGGYSDNNLGAGMAELSWG